MFLTAHKPTEQKARPFDEVIAMLDGAGVKSQSGIFINSDTAMRQSTVWACARIISEIIAQLPIDAHVKQGNTFVKATDHDLVALIHEPNDWQTHHDLISFLALWSELDGNGYLYKVKNGAGQVRKLLPIEGTDVSPDMTRNWKIDYTVSSEQGISGTFDSKRIFHLRNFGSDGYCGLSTIGNHREGIGLALQLESHAVNAYKNGLQTNKWVSLESSTGLTDETKNAFRTELRKFQGASNAGEIPVLNNAKINELQAMSATDAQYIESRKMQKQEIASIFGVPLFLLNDTEKSTTWGTGLEQISRSFVRFSLNPRLNRLGQTLVKQLLPEDERQKTKIVFDTDQFTLGEFKERMEGYKAGIESGVLNPNECREIEERNPRDGGDEYRQPLNIGTEGQIDEDETPDATP